MKKQFKVLVIAFVLLTMLANVLVVANAQSDTTATPKPFIGVMFNKADNGVEITDVLAGSPAETAGLQKGDIVTAVDGEAVTVKNFPDFVKAKNVGDTLTLTITRDGASQDITVTLGEMPAINNPGMPGMRGNRDNRGGNRGNFNGQMQERPYLGVQLAENDGEVVIAEVMPGSPAETAGLQKDDVITKVNDTDVTSAKDVIDAVQGLKTGDTVNLTVTRGEETVEISATLDTMTFMMQIPGDGQMPDMPNFDFDFGNLPGMRGMRGMELGLPLGAEIALLDETTAQEYNVTQTEGLYIVRVVTDSAAAKAGLKAGDVVTAVNGTAITQDTDFRTLLQEVNPGDKLTLDVTRDSETMQVEIEVGNMMMMPEMPFFRFHIPFGGNGQQNPPQPDNSKDTSTKSA